MVTLPSSSFFYTNPTPAQTPGLYAELEAAIAATDAATASSTALLAAYTVKQNTWASSVTIDWSLANCHRLTLSGATTSITMTNGRDGEKLILELKQDSTGSRLITLPAKVRFGSIIPSVILSTGANKIDKLGFMYNATDDKYDLVAVAYGFS